MLTKGDKEWWKTSMLTLSTDEAHPAPAPQRRDWLHSDIRILRMWNEIDLPQVDYLLHIEQQVRPEPLTVQVHLRPHRPAVLHLQPRGTG